MDWHQRSAELYPKCIFDISNNNILQGKSLAVYCFADLLLLEELKIDGYSKHDGLNIVLGYVLIQV